MQIFPAIDLRGGQVVRLYQGDYDKETVYAQDPCAVARDFIAAGAGYLHVVDLDGAKDGTLANFDTIAAIAGQGGLYIEVGGGIRDEDRIRRYLDLGVGRCILGTIAVKDFDFTERMAQTYGDRIAVGVDARDGYVAVSGWKELSAERAWTFAAASGTRASRPSSIRTSAGMGRNRAPIWRSTGSWQKLRAWTSPPPAASAVWRSCGSSGRSGPKPPFWARPCTRAVWI